MTLSSLHKKLALVISIFTIIGSLTTATVWLSGIIVTKDYLMIAVTDIRLGQIEESIARYHDIGIKNLTDTQKHRYNKLLLAEKSNNEQRKALLGL